jgi:hypothetical protein
MNEEVWIGMVDMAPRPGVILFADGRGAIANFLALARNELDFRTQLGEALDFYKLDLVTVEDIQPLAELRRRRRVSDVILAKAQEVEQTRNPRFDEFRVYLRNDE